MRINHLAAALDVLHARARQDFLPPESHVRPGRKLPTFAARVHNCWGTQRGTERTCLVNTVQAGYLLVLGGDQGGPVVRGRPGQRPSKARCIRKVRATHRDERRGTVHMRVTPERSRAPERSPWRPVLVMAALGRGVGKTAYTAGCWHLKWEPKTSSFLGTQPRMTQVPPAPPRSSEALVANGISQICARSKARPGLSREWECAAILVTGAVCYGQQIAHVVKLA